MKRFTIEQIQCGEWVVLNSKQTYRKAIKALDDILKTIGDNGIDFTFRIFDHVAKEVRF